MRSRQTSHLLSCLALVLAATHASSVCAEDKRIAVLTPTIDEADDSLAVAVGDALREEVRARPGVVVSDARISIEQLSIANDCDVETPDCLRAIAKGLSVDGLVYTSIARKGTSELVDVRYFDADEGAARPEKRATHVFVSAKPSQRDIGVAANGLVNELFGAPERNRDAAAPLPAGISDDESAAPRASQHDVDQADYADEPKSSGASVRRVAGFTLLGVAVVSVGLSALSFVQIDRAEGDEAFHDYQVAVGKQAPMVKDVCVEADHGERHGLAEEDFASVRDQCSMGATYEVLQYVFLGTAVVAGGVSAYLLLGEDTDSEHASRQAGTLALRPVVSRRSAGLHASLTF